ncbi:SMP-30/gluconolactonase/LRE family protein [Spirosoma validum]|uniref:SMP-30/gluconolactonase/LRE family protein n=1 Tax=Spirosoma validum TaxID=2771355 RepID=A0A927GE68_9BACT|nr:SMP-30/gluconolactonase/LRE family protein [Spirosoma validum]MBD2754388.1 SMP-30/gluconolactonase/LRE family protein [Spirosoma validum]
MKLSFRCLSFLILLTGCYVVKAQATQYATIGQVVRNDSKLNQLIPADAKIEIIAAGFGHLEGPVWIRDSSYLLVNDTKAQTTYKWSPQTGLSKFIEHNGYTGRMPYSEEPGSNGMTVDKQGRLIICDHGDRRIAALPLREKGGKRTLTDNFQGKRFSSPNDVVAHSSGSLYFSDPPYGLPLKDKDPTREMTVNGVYRLAANGTATLLVSDMTLPNGLAFSPDEKTLYVTQSDSLKPVINAYSVLADGSLSKGKLFFDGKTVPKLRYKEVPDGIKVDTQGNCWVAGPGGLLIISPAGKLLGRIDTGEVIANCAWGDDGSTLYIASGMFLCRIKTSVKGILPGN